MLLSLGLAGWHQGERQREREREREGRLLGESNGIAFHSVGALLQCILLLVAA